MFEDEFKVCPWNSERRKKNRRKIFQRGFRTHGARPKDKILTTDRFIPKAVCPSIFAILPQPGVATPPSSAEKPRDDIN